MHDYIVSGNGVVTLQSAKTGTRFTFQFRTPKARHEHDDRPRPIFVSALYAGDDDGYLGCLWPDTKGRLKYAHGRKSTVAATAPSVKAIAWAVAHIEAGRLPNDLHAWHEGMCGRCGRSLIVPESIESGLGPRCRKALRRTHAA